MSNLVETMNKIGFVKDGLFYSYKNYMISFLMSDENKKSMTLSLMKSHIDMDFIIETSDETEFIKKLKEEFKHHFRVDKINKLLNE
jgi:hypothetical protein